MARRCAKCDRPVSPRPEGRPVGVAYADADGTPIMLTVLFECACGSHQSCILWQDEECATEDYLESVAADALEREIAQTTRGFFSVTEELLALGV